MQIFAYIFFIMLINDNSELSQLNEKINSENSNKESLERLAAYLHNVDTIAKSSVKINEKNGVFYIKDWSGQIAALAAGANFYGLIYGATKHLKGTELLAEKRRLYESITGLSFVAVAGAPASQPRKSQPAKLAANEKKEALKSIIFGGWGGANGLAVTKYFASKTGANNTAFLEKYGVKPIEKYELSTGGEYTVNYQNFCFSLIANDWEKRRQPNSPNPKFRKPITQNRGKNSYIFGLAQLPATGENLIIFEGESDAICASWHKFNAIAIGGAGNKKSLDNLASELKARFKRVFVLFDNDEKSEKTGEKTGEKNGKELADKHGFIYVDTELTIQLLFAGLGEPIPKNCKDLCDIFAAGSAYGTDNASMFARIFLRLCTSTNGRINGLANDHLSVPIPHITIIPFRQYISEKTTVLDANGQIITVPYIHNDIYNPLQILALSIAKNKRVCLQATAGAGKSTALIDLIKDYLFSADIKSNKLYFEINTINRVVIAVPTIPLAEQLYTVFSGKDKYGIEIETYDTHGNKIIAPLPNCELITGEKSVSEKRASVDSDVIICTYDSVLIAGITENTILIADEAHQIITEKGYRLKATKNMLAAIKDAKHTLLLSATPNYLFNEIFGFKLVIGTPEITNTKHVEICEFTGKVTQLIPYVIDKYIAGGKIGTILIKQDNRTLLRAGAAYAKKIGLTSEVFASKSKNKNYISILKTAFLATKVNIIFTTRLIEAGVSIKDNISTIYICDTNNNAKIIQQLARPRFDAQTGANSFVNAVLFIQQNTANDKRKSRFAGNRTARQLYDYKLKVAQDKAEYLNKNNNFLEFKRLKTDAKAYILQTDKKDYIVDELAIMFDIDNAAITKDKNLIAERLQYTDSSIKNITFSTLQLSENVDFTDCKDAIKDEKEQAENIAISTLQNIAGTDKEKLNFILCKLVATEKNKEKKIGLTSSLKLQNDTETQKAATAFYKSIPEPTREILENTDANILGFLSKVADYMKLPNTPIFDAIDSAKVADKTAYNNVLEQIQILELKARKKIYRDWLKSGAPADKKITELSDQCEAANEIWQAFEPYIDNIKRGRRKPFLVRELAEKTNKILTRKDVKRSFKPKTETGENGVLKYLKTIFNVSKKIIDKKTYYILARKDTKRETAK